MGKKTNFSGASLRFAECHMVVCGIIADAR